MNQKIISTIIIFSLIIIIPTAYGQLTIGSEAKQESIEVKINSNGEIDVKHIVKASNMPSTLYLFSNEISNLVITNHVDEEIQSGIANDGKGNMLRVRTRVAYADECCMFGKLLQVMWTAKRQ